MKRYLLSLLDRIRIPTPPEGWVPSALDPYGITQIMDSRRRDEERKLVRLEWLPGERDLDDRSETA